MEDITALYRDTFPDVARVIKQLGGDLEMAKDLFHDAMIIYMEKAPSEIRVSAKAYLIGITRILWMKQQKLRVREQAIFLEDFHVPEAEQPLFDYLRAAGEKCMQLLQAFYYEQMDLREMADTFHYSNVRSVTVQKHKCLQKVRATVKNAMLYEGALN
ncbi:RNA polymerase sigma factor [Chitinophaga niabensis]|uniref:DNA-directed RNA polymerase specialized sigma subunit, sigma24 family n=1 Tax=Chitinophaga niabensis TaxID=536979 RepID=A0A1N6JZA1_9BACT|nr:sigma-70 family RNA polymerase sigma factor [Chitinophaga niabensis]SIO49628.1 DNA-directed RNA polymerase specialized sigma subunit, sigma24 family [Chitinophaga niabensis]